MANWSGLFDGILPTGAVAGHSFISNKNANKRHVSRLLGKPSMRKLKELMLTLSGAAVGQAAVDSYKRIQHEAAPGVALANGGMRAIEAVTTVDRVTNADDLAEMKDIIDDEWALTAAQYPEDKSGNGGGGKLAGKAY